MEAPDWLDSEIWAEMKKHRVRLKAPMTEYAQQLMLAKLEQWKADGFDPNESLNNSIENGWKGVFQPKHRTNKPLAEEEKPHCFKCGEKSDTGTLINDRLCFPCWERSRVGQRTETA